MAKEKTMAADEAKMDELIKGLEKDYGSGVIAQGKHVVACDSIPTGILSVDRALGIGGFPRGKLTEVFGNEGCGKSTTVLHACATAQKNGGKAVFIDVEHAFDPVYAEAIGVNVEDLWFAQPSSGEEALDICHKFADSGMVDIIVVDSVAALIPKEELDNPMVTKSYAPLPILMSKMMKHICIAASKSNTAVVFINQLRSKVGVIYGNPEQTTGGKALRFYASLRIELRKGEALKQGDDIIGHQVKFKVLKSRVSAPYVECEFDLYYGQGASPEADLLDLARSLKLVTLNGSWYNFGEIKIGNGKVGSIAALKNNIALFEELKYDIERHLDGESGPPIQD